MFAENLLKTVADIKARSAFVDLRQRGSLVANLTFIYHVTKASEKLLELAVIEAKERSDLTYYAHHLEEERGHHNWLAADLAAGGIMAEGTPLPELAVQMVGTQYYLLLHVDPACLLGYMAAIECSPTPMGVVEELENIHGPELLRTVRYHAVHDQDHRNDIQDALDGLRPESQSIVMQSAGATARYLAWASNSFVVKHG